MKSRHEDGSVHEALILFVLERLGPGASATFRATLGRRGPRPTGLRVERAKDHLTLANERIAARLPAPGTDEARAPLLGVRLPSGAWTRPSRYETRTAEAVATETRLLENGPVRLRARVTTRFDNGTRHRVTFTLWRGMASVQLAERFDVGPADKYRFKQYENRADRLAWEWWKWYGKSSGFEETHPNNWIVPLHGDGFAPKRLRYHGQPATDPSKGNPKKRGTFGYPLPFEQKRRLEKYLAPRHQWRPNVANWVAASAAKEGEADTLAAIAHSTRRWRNPNVLPLSEGITLRTGANDMRVISHADGSLLVRAPVGLGRRVWSLRVGTRKETLSAHGHSPDAPTDLYVRKCLGLDITRKWALDWAMNRDHPRLFNKAKRREAFLAKLREHGLLEDRSEKAFRRQWKGLEKRVRKMIDGYLTHGMTGNDYPGWMLGGWHGMAAAWQLDKLAGSPRAVAEEVRRLKRRLAFLTYCLRSRDAWPTKRINYGWGSMNMPVQRWGALVLMTLANRAHPKTEAWLDAARAYFDLLLETDYNAHGVHMSCPHYIGASVGSYYAWIAMAKNGVAAGVSESPVIERFARYYMQLMTPIDPRWGIRTLLTEGDTRPGSSAIPAMLATLLRDRAPKLAGQLMTLWDQAGRKTGKGSACPIGP